MKYEEPIMDLMYLESICIVTTSSIEDGIYGETDKGFEDIPGDGF